MSLLCFWSCCSSTVVSSRPIFKWLGKAVVPMWDYSDSHLHMEFCLQRRWLRNNKTSLLGLCVLPVHASGARPLASTVLRAQVCQLISIVHLHMGSPPAEYFHSHAMLSCHEWVCQYQAPCTFFSKSCCCLAPATKYVVKCCGLHLFEHKEALQVPYTCDGVKASSNSPLIYFCHVFAVVATQCLNVATLAVTMSCCST